ncbi:ABC transporter ATP-binding protein/permease [Staphylococcus carnosus]|uniref:ABC transporter required for expression of cytochrome bd, CydD n=1 Tax=Staphylococcus carnosus (strain TM300) TaxID=396513 RepID=B9DK60_STACT|nr:ABC transporter ATP-binding protein/permease [Staphylococcus carnosus]QPT03429.1 ABC transporter ATP-binding protein/permease [Staphylococcus carnosus]UQA66152.1 ABC transporter ATP-binding protein/permease [Staphylococcus carnosus]UTB79010.1 cysteine ABC transporter ATP-binding protein [Staphylococcus carnosus]UTB88563.1 cysteine ABC transporter ATP-binding protein [Staphylococcus carnosus]UTB90911.1 cysteine ABC transporter ATP-binding protein [Staphylococcus carnosus]
MKNLTRYIQKYISYPILMAIVCAMLAIVVVVQNVTIAKVLDIMLTKAHSSISLTAILGILLAILILRAVLNMSNQLLGTQLAYKVKTNLRKRAVTQNADQPIGEQMSVITESIDGIAPFYQDYLPQVFKAVMIPLFIIIAMCFIHLNTALIMMVTAPFIPVFYILFGLKTRDESKDQMTYLTQFSQRFLNLAQGLITLKLFNRSKQAEATIYQESTKFRDKTMKILRSAFLSGLMLEFISLLGIGLVALEAGLGLVLFHNINFQTAAIAIILAPEFYNSIKDLGQAFHTGKQSEGAADVVFDMLDVDSNHDETTRYSVDTSQAAQIHLDQVSYHYPNTERLAVDGVTLDIDKGDHIALVGPSGAGKTTLSQLILQIRQPSKGIVTFNKEDLKLGVLSQQPYIFNASIRENVTMFKEVPDAEVMKVIEAVGLTDKIKSLPDGLDTAIGEGGEMLSGGQMRRIELSRVLLDRPEVVVFDEPATGLDVWTERIIQTALKEYFDTRTVIMIAHRQSTIRAADRRIYMKQGRIETDDQDISIGMRKGREKA